MSCLKESISQTIKTLPAIYTYTGSDGVEHPEDGVYTTMWNVYLNEELKYTSTSPFMDLKDQAFKYCNFNHVDPTGAQKGGQATLYTAGDLAASMELNPYPKVFSANGYYDAVTPFFQTVLDLANMPLGNPKSRDNLVFGTYESGHMIYLDNQSWKKMKAHLDEFYDEIRAHFAAERDLVSSTEGRISRSRYRRRLSRTPY